MNYNEIKKLLSKVLILMFMLTILSLNACLKDDCESCSSSTDCKNDCYWASNGSSGKSGNVCASSGQQAIDCLE